ncbi:Heavy metal-associated isoprenylated plant protein 41 [Linum grandiflorum]
MGQGILIRVLSFVLQCFGGHNHKDHHHDKEGRRTFFQDQGLLVALEATSRDPKPLVVLSHPTNITPKLVDPSPPLFESTDVVVLQQGRGDCGRRQVNVSPSRKDRRKFGDEVKVWRVVGVVNEVWKKHYCSSHKILLVGEGDFSFSSSLALAFGSAVNIVATSLDSQEFLYTNYKRAMANIAVLWARGCLVINELDATQMAGHTSLKGMKFDRIVFNFPHAGFYPTETSVSQIRISNHFCSAIDGILL